MKALFIILIILSVFASNGQTVPPLDPSKVIKISHASPILARPCSGWANPQSIDLKWKPLLTKKIIESENESPDKDYVDSIKAYKLKLKEEYELKHSNNRSGERTTTVTPIVGTNFSGYTPDGSQPLDNCVAISNGGIIVSVENDIMAYYNTSGTLLGETSLYSLLSPYFTLYNVCDPVIVYDPNYDRFIFFCEELNSSGLFNNNRIFVCFSKTNNPSTGGWYYYEWTGDPTGTGDAYDYPKMAINDSELFITGNLYSEPSGTYNQAVIFQMNKLAGYAGSSISWVYYQGSSIGGSPATILPVSYGQNGDITTTMILVSTQVGGGNTINYYKITGNWCCAPTISYASISTTPYTLAANALQQGTTTKLRTDDCRALGGFYLTPIIHFVFHSDFGSGYTGINYNRLDLTTLTNTSSLVGSLGYDFTYPSVASYATTTTDKSVMIGFGLSGSTIYPQIDVVNCDDTMTWSGYTTVYSSPNYIQYAVGDTLDRWGDYTGMSRDNSSSTAIVWMSGMRANASYKWQTWIAEINGTATPTCTIPSGLTATSVTTTSELLSWTASGAASYNVQYRIHGTTTWTTTTSATTSITITGLTPATEYDYEVQSVCTGSGVSSYSIIPDFITLSTPTCSTPTGLAATPISSTSEALSWNPVSGALSYTVQYSISGSGIWTPVTGIPTPSTTLNSLTPNTVYEFDVQAVCSSLSSSASSPTPFTTLNNLGVASTQNTNATKVFPNPIINIFSVEFSLSNTFKITLAS